MNKDLIQGNRTRFGYIYALIVLIFSKPQKISRTLFLVGVIIACFGEWIRFYSAGFVKKGVELAKTGPYAYVRNPLYVGSFFIALGASIISYSALCIAFFLIFFLVFYPSKVKFEEEELRKTFGDEFDEYTENVPQFFPKFKVDESEKGKFRLDLAIKRNREYHGIIGTVLVLGFMYFKRKLLKK